MLKHTSKYHNVKNFAKVFFFLLFFSYSFIFLLGKDADKESINLCPAKFLNDIAIGKDSTVWAASENEGMWYFKDGKWLSCKGMTTLGDYTDFTSVAVDKQGRVWAGTFDKGVYVYKWQRMEELQRSQRSSSCTDIRYCRCRKWFSSHCSCVRCFSLESRKRFMG